MTGKVWKSSALISREDKTLSNNVIHSIAQADSSCLWVSTHLGSEPLLEGVTADCRQL